MATLSGWVEAAIVILGITLAVTLLTNDWNDWTGGNLTIGYSDAEAQLGNYTAYQTNLQTELGGEVKWSTTLGLQLESAWSIIKSLTTITWNFISGGWIEETLTQNLHLNSLFAKIIRLMFFLSMGLIVLRIMFRVKP